MATELELDRSDRVTLERLNQEYVDAFMSANVEWYREHLAEDFVCIESDGSVLDKAEFLTNTGGSSGCARTDGVIIVDAGS